MYKNTSFGFWKNFLNFFLTFGSLSPLSVDRATAYRYDFVAAKSVYISASFPGRRKLVWRMEKGTHKRRIRRRMRRKGNKERFF